MAEINNIRLPDLAEENQIVLVADANHADELIRKTITSQLEAMHTAGVKHLYLEHDPKDVSLEELLVLKDEQGDLVREATRLKMQVHFFDDRSLVHQLDARHPEAASFANDVDPYLQDVESLAWKSANPAEMKDYIRDVDAHWKADSIDFRNGKMVENLSNELNKHPDEKSLIIAGSGHSNGDNDIDEGLRNNGHQVTTARINTEYTNGSSYGTDYPDFIIRGETGAAISFKNSETGRMQRLIDADDLPVKNTEPVAELSSDELSTKGNFDQNNDQGIVHSNRDIPDHIRDYLIINKVSDFISNTNDLSNEQRDLMQNYLDQKRANMTEVAKDIDFTKELDFSKSLDLSR